MKRMISVLSMFLVLGIGILLFTGCSRKQDDKRMVVRLNTEGMGQVAYYASLVNQKDFDDEHPSSFLQTTLPKKTKVTIDAKASEGWQFVEWKYGKKKYSNESKVEITVTKDIELTAIFEKVEK